MPLVKVKDINMYYKVFSKDKEINQVDPDAKTIIVLHGGFGILDHQVEVPAWKSFSNQLQMVFVDQRGCGQTDDGDPKLWTMDQLGDDIYEFSKALTIEQPIVAGISSGGYATIAYATRHPEHPRALILVNTEPTISPQAKKEAYLALGIRSDRRDFAPFKELSDTQIIQYAKTAANAAYNYDMEPTLENFDEFAKSGFSIISKKPYSLTAPVRKNMEIKKKFANGYKMFDYRPNMHKITCPVLWFAGEWDPLHPKCCAAEGAKLLPNGRLHILRAGAPAYHDDRAGFEKAMEAFIQELNII